MRTSSLSLTDVVWSVGEDWWAREGDEDRFQGQSVSISLGSSWVGVPFLSFEMGCGSESGTKEEEEEEEEANENPSSFFRFLKTLVVHFTAKRALEKHVLQVPNEGINFSLFSVERSALAIPNGSWSTMEDMIRELFSSEDHSSTLTDVTATKAVEILKDKVSKTQNSAKYERLFSEFKLFIDNNGGILLTGGLHCETILATLGKYYKSCKFLLADDNANLTSICKVLLLFTCLLILSEHLSLETT